MITPWTGAPWTPRTWQATALPQIGAALRAGGTPLVSAVMGSGKSILVTEVVHLFAEACKPNEVVIIGVPTTALVRQLSATLTARLAPGTVGQFYGRRKQDDRRVIVTCYPSAATLQGRLQAAGKRVRLFVADEAHQTQADTVRTAIQSLNPAYALGVTATPYRSDTNESLELWDRVAFRYSLGDALRDGVLVPWRTVNWDGVGSSDVDAVCARLITEYTEGPGIVSARTIADAEEYAEYLRNAGIPALCVHSGLGHREQDKRIAALKAGEIKALVHVSMLQEGVDFPWLQWLCMRRPVTARVRFAQELGRVLRCHPGKTQAIVLDPHDLMGIHGIAQAPTLGAAEQPPLLPPAAVGNPDAEPGPREAPLMPPAVAIEHSTTWARHMLLVLQAHAVAEPSIPDGHWRTRRPSGQQIRTLEKMAWAARYLPSEIRDSVKALAGCGRSLQRGAVSDLISVLWSLADASKASRDARRAYALPDGIVFPALPDGVLAGLG